MNAYLSLVLGVSEAYQLFQFIKPQVVMKIERLPACISTTAASYKYGKRKIASSRRCVYTKVLNVNRVSAS